MPMCLHRFILELFKQDGAALGKVAVTVDWEPAREWTRFSAVRRGLLPLSDPATTASIHPVWHSETGAPYLQGFRVVIDANGAGEVSEGFPTAYFQGLARQASAHFVEKGKLREGEHFRYLVVAYPCRQDPATEKAIEFNVEMEEVESAVPCREASLSDFLSRGVPEGTVDAEDMPVFIAQRILDEAAKRTRASDGLETGGVLIGHLYRDSVRPEIFAEVTAQIEAEGHGEATKFSFTADTWNAVRAAARLRNKSEIYLGYWHSHPVRAWCKDKQCTRDMQQTCAWMKDFFSEDDRALLRTVFPRAYSIGLVCTDAPLREISFSLFGWRRGFIEPRGFYITGG